MKALNKTDLARVKNNTSQNNNPRFDLKYFPQSDLLSNRLNEMFPEQVHEDKTVRNAKEILGDKCTTEDAKSMIASFEYLIKAWLEEYERKIFDMKTLKELLHSF